MEHRNIRCWDDDIFRNNFIIAMLFFAFVYLIFQIIDIIQDTRKRNKIRDAEIKAIPYKKHYEELLQKGKYKEAITYGQKYGVHMRNSYYYW